MCLGFYLQRWDTGEELCWVSEGSRRGICGDAGGCVIKGIRKG